MALTNSTPAREDRSHCTLPSHSPAGGGGSKRVKVPGVARLRARVGKSRQETNVLLPASIRSQLLMFDPPSTPERIDSATMQQAGRLANNGPPRAFAAEGVDRDNGVRPTDAALGARHLWRMNPVWGEGGAVGLRAWSGRGSHEPQGPKGWPTGSYGKVRPTRSAMV